MPQQYYWRDHQARQRSENIAETEQPRCHAGTGSTDALCCRRGGIGFHSIPRVKLDKAAILGRKGRLSTEMDFAWFTTG